MVAAAELARAFFGSSAAVATSSSSGIEGGMGIGADTLITSQRLADEPFELALADTEESDAPTDPELGRADYWTCVKCKNRQNNPMYRYCEKCYQVKIHDRKSQIRRN